MDYTIIDQPAGPPVTLAEVKEALRIDLDDSDADLSALIASAVEEAQHETGLFLMRQKVRVALMGWPVELVLERGPVESVAEISYLSGGQWVALPDGSSALYRQDTRWRIDPITSWPSVDSVPGVTVRVDLMVGFADAAAVPASIKRWVIARVGYWYANPNADLSSTVMRGNAFLGGLLQPHSLY